MKSPFRIDLYIDTPRIDKLQGQIFIRAQENCYRLAKHQLDSN